MITIVDYGLGNLGSIANMFKRIGVEAQISSNHEVIDKAEKLLLPGVGAFDAAVERIDGSKLRELLNKKALIDKVPVLGICLGMQLLTNKSEEGELKGLGWIDAETIRFKFDPAARMPVPHMGWNDVAIHTPSALTTDLPEEPRYYFVHSYYVKCVDEKNVILRAHYGHWFDAAIQKDNIMGAQFHPEKSHKFGMKLLENFAKI